MQLCPNNKQIPRLQHDLERSWSLVRCEICGLERVGRDKRSCCVLGEATLEHLCFGARPSYLTPLGDGTFFTKKEIELQRERFHRVDMKRDKRRVRESKTCLFTDIDFQFYFLEKTSNSNDFIRFDLYDDTCTTLVVGDISRAGYCISSHGIRLFFFISLTCVCEVTTEKSQGVAILNWFRRCFGTDMVEFVTPPSELNHEMYSPREMLGDFITSFSSRAFRCLDLHGQIFTVRLHPNGTVRVHFGLLGVFLWYQGLS